MRVSVVVPVLNAAPYIPGLAAAFAAQHPSAPDEVILVDSQSTDRTTALAADLGWKVLPIVDFSHGRSRNRGAEAASGDVVVFLSQDARPADEEWLAKLVAPFDDARVAAAYSRQVPRSEANPMERYFLHKRFPAGAAVRREKGNAEHLGLEDVFFSNVSAAVRRESLLACPFDESLIMSEDQQLSRDLLESGCVVVYEPGSVVEHSHNYTLKDVFQRYFDSVYSLTVIFPDHGVGTSTSMGLRYLGEEICHIVRTKPLWLPYYVLYTGAKVAGTVAAHWADRMPRWLLRRFSLHAYHWHGPEEPQR